MKAIIQNTRYGSPEVLQLAEDGPITTMPANLTSENRFDFVFDAVGKSSFGQCKPILKKTESAFRPNWAKEGKTRFWH